MSASNAVRLITGLVLVGGTGCGGLVVFVEDDDAGGTGSGGDWAGPGPGPDTSSTNGSNNSSSATGTPGSLCDQYCAVWGSCHGASCELYCNEYVGGACAAEGTDYFSCLAASPNNGCFTEAGLCESEALPFLTCFGPLPNCFGESCDEDEAGFCSCVGVCGGSTLQQFCQSTVDGGEPGQPSTCDCYLDDSYIGSCDTTAECGVEEGCCQVLAGSFN